ncbi:MAG: hypothetical protein HY931_02145 [Candidatus Falkowbacteria bacterium]|nr:MAG: hypothetical protein HY931_02145 [Candidatus Falkowbacteria bacterium]
MSNEELKQILSELYILEPSLKVKEADLIILVQRMTASKPNLKFDAAFVSRLKAEIMKSPLTSQTETKININSNFNFMDKKLYFAFGSLAVASLAFLFFLKTTGVSQQTQILIADNKVGNSQSDTAAVDVLPAGAFGSLASLGTTAINANNASAGKAVAFGMGGGGGVAASAEMATFTATPADASSIAAVSPMAGVTTDMKIMPPYYGFKYVYKGEPLNLEGTSAAVYRRIKGDDAAAKNMANLISAASFSGLDFSTFSNLKAANITLMEDKDLGLVVYFDFNEGNINIYENWEKWTYPERDACANDQSCWDRYRIKISDVPADADLISMADGFLSTHNVQLDHYGSPLVDNYWRDSYEQTADKTNFYIPEYATVVYPLLIDGQAVRDQSGNYAGLRVTINLHKKAASGLNGLVPYRYESSQYDLETATDTIVKIAENGGWNGNYYFQAENVQTIELGTPEKAYVQIYRYAANRNEELLVPALIFPVINVPSGAYYYGQKYVTVPLVKEMLNDLGNQPVPMPYMIKEGGGTSGSSGASSGAIEIAPASEPVIDLVEPTPASKPVLR